MLAEKRGIQHCATEGKLRRAHQIKNKICSSRLRNCRETRTREWWCWKGVWSNPDPNFAWDPAKQSQAK